MVNFEERFDRLTERHEALAGTLEITAGLQRKREEMMAQPVESVTSLARIAHAHERRLSNLEGM